MSRFGPNGGNGIAERVAADLFAGFLISMILLLVVVFLQTIEIQKLRRVKQIFQKALDEIEDTSDQIESKDGKITVDAEALFESGRWVLDPVGTDQAFGGVRTALAQGIEQLDRDLEQTGYGTDSSDYVEVRVVGHADCQHLSRRVDRESTIDNLDLSGLRAASIARYLTEPCAVGPGTTADPEYECCPDGTLDCSTGARTSLRLDPSRWSVMPVSRSSWEPRDVPKRLSDQLPGGCDAWSPDQLQLQRRVVIEVVPRLDRLLGDDTHTH